MAERILANGWKIVRLEKSSLREVVSDFFLDRVKGLKDVLNHRSPLEIIQPDTQVASATTPMLVLSDNFSLLMHPSCRGAVVLPETRSLTEEDQQLRINWQMALGRDPEALAGIKMGIIRGGLDAS